MRVIDQSWKWGSGVPDGKAILKIIEAAGRTCYKSEDKATEESAEDFVGGIIKRGHESVLEHCSLGVRIITDRGVSHEIVRHRLASYSQESTRYCDYGKKGEVVFIRPVWVEQGEWEDHFPGTMGRLLMPAEIWHAACEESERLYLNLITAGWLPQQARTVLNNSLKTELVMTANIREWRHFFRLRASKAAHPQMRELALSMLKGFKEAVPVVFEDIKEG